MASVSHGKVITSDGYKCRLHKTNRRMDDVSIYIYDQTEHIAGLLARTREFRAGPRKLHRNIGCRNEITDEATDRKITFYHSLVNWHTTESHTSIDHHLSFGLRDVVDTLFIIEEKENGKDITGDALALLDDMTVSHVPIYCVKIKHKTFSPATEGLTEKIMKMIDDSHKGSCQEEINESVLYDEARALWAKDLLR